MVFSSSIFLFIFLPAALLAYYLLDGKFRNIFLLLISLLFYAWGEPVFVIAFAAMLVVNYALSLWIAAGTESGAEKGGKAQLTITVLMNLAMLFVFKYLNFTTRNINLAASLLGMEQVVKQTSIALPLGISFFIFQVLSYQFDIYYKKIRVDRNFLNFALYISFFPQLLQGPIVRYETMLPDLRERKTTAEDFAMGVIRFVIGLFKKSVIANTLAVAVDAAFEALGAGKLTVGYGWLGGIAYSLQIYFDFAGYSDMALGLGLMFGFHFKENFNFPYMSATVSEFWRRWHISLGTWFRDYVYIPLGGNRVSRGRLIFNLFAVWALTGIWHGANWTFIVWGLLYFVLLTLEKESGVTRLIRRSRLAAALYRVFTLVSVICGWVMFRSATLGEGSRFIAAMFGFAPNGGWSYLTGSMWKQYAVILLFAVVCSVDWRMVLPEKWTETVRAKTPAALSSVIQLAVLAVAAVVAVSFSVASTYNPFIYFNF